MFADLHTHSTGSDGVYTPREVAERAVGAGVGVLAICDHDTVAGVRELAGDVPEGVRLIPGVEVSSVTPCGKCHILGLGFDPDHPAIVSLMEEASRLRRGKLEARLAFLKKSGYDLPEEDIAALRAMPSAGKPQVADALVRRGFAPDITAAMRDILDRCPPVPDRVEAARAVAAIRAAGGAAVWAHPYGETGKRALTEGEFDAMLRELTAEGITAMECWYAKYPVERCLRLERLAARHGLAVSGGSDCHGRPDTAPVGRLNAEGVPVDIGRLTVLELLKEL